MITRFALFEGAVKPGQTDAFRAAVLDRDTRSPFAPGHWIEPGTVIGEDADADRERGFRVTDEGSTLVTPDMLGQQLHFTR